MEGCESGAQACGTPGQPGMLSGSRTERTEDRALAPERGTCRSQPASGAGRPVGSLWWLGGRSTVPHFCSISDPGSLGNCDQLLALVQKVAHVDDLPSRLPGPWVAPVSAFLPTGRDPLSHRPCRRGLLARRALCLRLRADSLGKDPAKCHRCPGSAGSAGNSGSWMAADQSSSPLALLTSRARWFLHVGPPWAWEHVRQHSSTPQRLPLPTEACEHC